MQIIMIYPTLAAITLILAILGGLLNRARGGWLDDSTGIDFSHGLLRAIMALFTTACLYAPYYLFLHKVIEPTDYIWMAAVFLTIWFLGLVPGWGSWFMVGRDRESYKHNEDWILSEWLAYLFYGKKWIPSVQKEFEAESGVVVEQVAKNPKDMLLLKRFNYELSPTGRVRRIEWRTKMERFAMNIRGLNITLPAAVIFYFHLEQHSYDYDIELLFFYAISGYFLGYIYELGHKVNLSKMPPFMRWQTAFGEVLAGATILSSIPFVISYFVLN